MLQRFIVFSLCLVAIRASGEFTVVSSPKAISFEGNDVLDSDFVGDVIAAGLGNDVGFNTQWEAMYINEPFGVAKRAAVVLVEGVDHVKLESSGKTFKVSGSNSAASLRTLIAGLKDRSEAVCDLDFNDIEEAQKTYRTFLGDTPVRSIQESQNFNPKLHLADKEFLQSIDLANAVADNIKTIKNFQLLVIRLNLQGIIEAHQADNAAVTDAKRYVDILVSKLDAGIQELTQNEALVVVVTNKASNERTKRQAVTPQNIDLNLALVYNEDYPVIFNIILWFMVIFGLSLLAISYAIGSMDPGRDSIIYRMTSTRMKKDN